MPAEGERSLRTSGRPEAIARRLDTWGYAVLAVAFGAELASTLVVVAAREFAYVIAWQPEVSQLGLAVLTFVGGAVAYSQGYQMSLSFAVARFAPRVRAVLADGVDAIVLVGGLMAAALSIPLLTSGWSQRSAILQWPITFFVLPYTAGTLLLATYAGLRLWSRWRRATLPVLSGVLGVALLTVAGSVTGTVLPTSAALAVAGVLFAALLAIGLPIGVGLFVAPLTAMLVTNVTEPIVVPTRMDDAITDYVFLAVPFFVFAGLILANSGVSQRLTALMQRLVGRIRSGFYQSILVSMFFFSGLSGSKFADMAAVGTPMGDMLDRAGHPRDEAAAVLSAAAVMGETIPPSIGLLILGSITSVSIASLFVGGIIPAVVLGVILMLYVHRRAQAMDQPRGDASAGGLGRVAAAAVPALLLPVILIGGIVGGVATPTEVSSFAVVYGLLLAGVVYRVRADSLWQSLKDSLATSGWILFLVSGASVLSWIFTYQQVPQEIAHLAVGLASKPLFMLLSLLILIVLGTVLEGAAAIIVLAPILVPAAQAAGINPIQYGLVLIIAIGLGTHLPPIGVGLYVASSVMRTAVEKVFKPMAVYALILMVGLLAVAFISPLTLFLPHAFGLH